MPCCAPNSIYASSLCLFQMVVCQILAFLEQNATVTQMDLGHVGHVQQVFLAMAQSVKILMRY